MSLAPDAISDLELWLDADAITGLSDGDTVITWADQSGNGNDYTNIGSNTAVKYQTGVLNGLPIVEMTSGGFSGPLSLASPYSIFYVGRYTIGGSTGAVAVRNSNVSWWFGPNSAEWRWSANFHGVSSGVTADTNWVVHGVTQEILATREEAPFAGGLQYVYDLDSNAVPSISALQSASDIGAMFLGGAGAMGAGNAMGGDIAEVVAYSRDLSVTERVGLTDYFREKWGGIVASSSEDTDIDARIAREALVVAHNFPAAEVDARIAREAITVAHHFPELETDVRIARLSVVIAISRPHGWD